MMTLLLAVSFPLAGLAAPCAAPQQPLQAELAITHRLGKIDFRLAAAPEFRDDAGVERPDGGKRHAPIAVDAAPIAVCVDDRADVDATTLRPAPKPTKPPQPQAIAAKAIPPACTPAPIAPRLAGSPALLVASLSPHRVHFVDLLPPLLVDGVVLAVGKLDTDGVAVVSRDADSFPVGIELYAQAVLLVEGRILASDVGAFTGAGRRSRS
jgi:hypothetical protein